MAEEGRATMRAADTSVRRARGLPADDPLRALPPDELAQLLEDVIASWPRAGIPRGHDPIMEDIIAAVDEGHFDRRMDDGPSQLETTTVSDLLGQVQMMSPERRRLHLAQMGNQGDCVVEELAEYASKRSP